MFLIKHLMCIREELWSPKSLINMACILKRGITYSRNKSDLKDKLFLCCCCFFFNGIVKENMMK